MSTADIMIKQKIIRSPESPSLQRRKSRERKAVINANKDFTARQLNKYVYKFAKY